MADSKIELTLGSFRFSCEGEKEWVEVQLGRILDRAPSLLSLGSEVVTTSAGGEVEEVAAEEARPVARRGRKPREVKAKKAVSNDPLVDYLKEKKADNNQVRKFLATAVYLHSQGAQKFSTPMISKKLKAAGIPKLSNASDCLNKNVKKGFSIKEDKEFVLTNEGIQAIIGEANQED
jgi:hypothetical protein